MYKLGIISRDWRQLNTLIEEASLTDLEIAFAGESISSNTGSANLTILLADPGLVSGSLEDFSELTWLQSTWAGVAPLVNGKRQDYQLTGVKNLFGPQMSEYVFTYILYFARQVKQYQLLQDQCRWQPLPNSGVAGKRLGIMGVGSIGAHVAKMAKNFGMSVSGFGRRKPKCEDINHFYSPAQGKAFCANLDYLLCLLPETSATKGLVNAEFLRHLPTRCVFINAGRGTVVDDQDLIAALHNHELQAAVLDVFNQEPLPPEHPYWNTPNVVITQHSAAISRPEDIAQIFIANYLRYQNKQPLDFVVDWHKGY